MTGSTDRTRNGTHPLIAGYLARLDAATADLSAEAREDLHLDVRAHLEEVVAAGASEAQLRDAIDRLGPPERMANEARSTLPPPTGAPVPPAALAASAPIGIASAAATSSTAYDVVAVVCVLLLPVLLLFLLGLPGAILGVAIAWGLLWGSRTWTAREKLLGTLVWPGGLLLPAYLSLVGGQVCTVSEEVDAAGVVTVFEETCQGFSFHPAVGIPLVLLLVLAPIVVGMVLLQRGARRRVG